MAKTKKNEVATQEKESPLSLRFTNAVIREFQDGVGEVALTSFQKRLAQNYFMSIDDTLKTAEAGRMRKNEKYRDKVPVTWNNIDMVQVARDVVTYARIGLDPAQKNHIHVIPFKNNSTGKYDITFMEGYRGLELKAQKYGLDVPDAIVVETVFSNDTFREIKKDRNNQIEDYEFEVTNPFDRGEIIGGFYYHIYNDDSFKNKLRVFNLNDIMKRKPAYASAEFWGGEKDIWKDGKKTGKKEKVEGWYEEMVYKTIYRAAHNAITIDSQKIDDNYIRLKQLEDRTVEISTQAEVDEKANKETLDFDMTEAIDVDIEELEEVEELPEAEPETLEEVEPKTEPEEIEKAVEAIEQISMEETPY